MCKEHLAVEWHEFESYWIVCDGVDDVLIDDLECSVLGEVEVETALMLDGI